MLYNKHNLAVAKVASKDTIRPEISGVFFTKDKTVATDSFRLIEMGVVKEARIEDFPKVQGRSAMHGVKPFILYEKAVKEIKLKDGYVGVSHLDDNGVEFLWEDRVQSYGTIKGEYPKYEGLFPTKSVKAEVMLNAEYLKGVLDVLGKLNYKNAVKIKLYGARDPVVIESGNDNQKGRAMIMPIMD